MKDVTKLLNQSAADNAQAAEQLLPLVYEELRRVAGAMMARERPGQTLQPTALVHEAWLRVGADKGEPWENRAHFFGAAAEAMRRILVDRARKRASRKHGGSFEKVDFAESELLAPEVNDADLLAVNEALEKFSDEHPQHAQLVKLRYFVGMTTEEAAEALGISLRTAKRWWTYARAWLKVETGR